MSLVLAAGAALLAAVAVVMQRVALESAPHDSLSPRLIGHAVRRRGWLAGFALLLGVFVLQASALRRTSHSGPPSLEDASAVKVVLRGTPSVGRAGPRPRGRRPRRSYWAPSRPPAGARRKGRRCRRRAGWP